MKVVYEDNHIIIVDKCSGEIVQGDKTGDKPLSDTVKEYIKQKYNKPGNVFLGVVHRLDRPVSGLVVFAKTSKALSRLNDMFRTGDVHKTYWAVVKRSDIAMEGTLTDWLTRNERQNKSYAHQREVPGAKKAVLKYKVRAVADNYMLIEVTLLTGRHHQIRCQLAHMGCPIKGDLNMERRAAIPTAAYHCCRAEWNSSIPCRRRTSWLTPMSLTTDCGTTSAPTLCSKLLNFLTTFAPRNLNNL